MHLCSHSQSRPSKGVEAAVWCVGCPPLLRPLRGDLKGTTSWSSGIPRWLAGGLQCLWDSCK
eukprot:12370049-Prorocentrum_lima.AAC.1